MATSDVKQLKVDNWGVFFLQRLQIFHDKEELCDLTLKFKKEKPIKVHKLVLNACTDYFDRLAKDGSELVMPDSLKYEHVLPIVNFMYTGKLEYNNDQHSQLYETALALNITILARLLSAQAKPKPTTPTVIKSYSRKSIVRTPQPSTPSTSTPVATSTPSALPGKKLPIWKRRTVPGYLPDESNISDGNAKQSQTKHELPRPTRFEWPEEMEVPPVVYNPTFDVLSYESKPMMKPVDNLEPLNVVLKGASGNTENNAPSTPNTFKRTGPSIVLGGSRTKRTKLSERVFSAPESDDDDDEDHFETHYLDHDDDDEDEEFLPSTPTTSKPTSPKPILKPLSSDTASPSTGKKVRFSLSNSSAGKENTVSTDVAVANTSKTQTTNISLTTDMLQKSSNPSNHAKIIAEVLKKYPDLVKNSKNIKLKILPQGSGGQICTTTKHDGESKSPKTKVSYVVMSSDQLKKKIDTKPAVPQTGAENTTGPWMCITCGTDEEPMPFDTYYNYRKHLQDVHNERIDARICEHCGFKSSKRNLHLYHLYTKHNIAPPRNINFPKCDKCNYIALSESLLIKHRNNHSSSSKDYVCWICNAAFKSSGALQGHMQTNLHQDQGTKKDYKCNYCGKIFNRNINLKAHVRTAHQEDSRKFYDEEDRVDDPDEVSQTEQNILQVIEVPVINNVQSSEKHTLVLQPGMTILTESPAVPLMPSSESEALNNVASGIATSINIADPSNIVNEQTVILLDENSEFILQSTPMMLNQDGTCQEYIVPEIMTSESGQVYTASLVNYSVGNGIYSGNVVTNTVADNIIKTSDHTYADDGTLSMGHNSVQVNGCTEVRVTDNISHNNTHHQGVLIIGTTDEGGSDSDQQVTSEILIDNSSGNLLMDGDWVQVNPIGEPQVVNDKPQEENVENNAPSTKTSEKVADNLIKDWDMDDDTAEDDTTEESDVKPSRPTIELEETIIPDK